MVVHCNFADTTRLFVHIYFPMGQVKTLASYKETSPGISTELSEIIVWRMSKSLTSN